MATPRPARHRADPPDARTDEASSLRREVDEARARFVEEQELLEAAAAELRMALEEVEAAARKGREHILSGGAAVDLPVVAGIGPLRAELARRIEAFDAARMVTRRANMRLAVWEGSSASEIARRYGVSRQYVSKLLHDGGGR